MHYHGTPITPRARLLELAGRHFCVSYAEPRDVEVAHRIGQSVMLDNGAYSIWRDPARTVDWDEWAVWADRWLAYPTTWAVLPDSVDGVAAENDGLIDRYAPAFPAGQVAPVWHLHEPLERLHDLVARFDRVCFGSSGLYADVGAPAWHRRVCEAFDDIAGAFGRVPWIHMLRGLAQAGGPYPFSSVDSSYVAQTHAAAPSRGKSAWGDIAARVAELDSRQCPPTWRPGGWQLDLDHKEEAVP